jgi:hypothetical protein
MKLTPQAVEDLTAKCLHTDDESLDGAIRVEGIAHTYAFHPGRIAENTSVIAELLAELPDEFQASKGGGWSFLNACNDRHGEQWTGLHLHMERLFCLGIAADKARWLMPREMWEHLPGGIPVRVN